jgi:hypothetical protein
MFPRRASTSCPQAVASRKRRVAERMQEERASVADGRRIAAVSCSFEYGGVTRKRAVVSTWSALGRGGDEWPFRMRRGLRRRSATEKVQVRLGRSIDVDNFFEKEHHERKSIGSLLPPISPSNTSQILQDGLIRRLRHVCLQQRPVRFTPPNKSPKTIY